LKKDAAARVAKGREKINWKDVTPKGYGPKEGVEIDEKKMPADLKRKQQEKRKKWMALGKKNPDKVYARGYYKRLKQTGHGAKDPKMGRKQGMKAQAGEFVPGGTMINEKWAVGVVYHQDFGGGEISYFRADSLLKNGRWKGMAVDEYGGKQKKPRNITADEKVQGWKITPKDKIPKGLKEEIQIKSFSEFEEEVEIDEKFAGWIAFYNNDKLEIKPKKGEIDSLNDAKQAAIKHFKVPKSKQGLLAIEPAHEEVELAEKGTAYPATIDTLRMIVKDKQHQTVMFKSGKAIVDLFTASAMVQVYDALKKPDMKKTFEKMIADKAGFMKTQAFAMKMIG